MIVLHDPENPSDNWRGDLRRYLNQADWPMTVAKRSKDNHEILGSTLHLAVFVEPFLEWILEGRKTIESRFSKRRVAPYGAVRAGDRLILKRSSGPVLGICRADSVLCYELDPERLRRIRTQYSKALCATEEQFWEAHAKSRYVTLIHLKEVQRLAPFRCSKRDRRGWVPI